MTAELITHRMAGISAVFPDQIPIGAISGTAAAPSFAQCRHTGRPQPVNRAAVSQCWFGRSCADASDPGQPDDRDERRKQHPLDVQFIAGIREHGVLQPITAIRTDGVELRDGQRRAHAARQVDLATIPVSVVFESLPSGRWPRVMSSARSQAVGIPAFKPAHSSAARSNYGVHMAIPPIPAVLAPQEAEAQDR